MAASKATMECQKILTFHPKIAKKSRPYSVWLPTKLLNKCPVDPRTTAIGSDPAYIQVVL